MRGMIEQLPSPHPLEEFLPSMLREDAFARDLCASFDDLLAPVFLSLDTFVSYLDPELIPDDAVPWLAHWLGVTRRPRVDEEGLRKEMRYARLFDESRGTKRHLEVLLKDVLDVSADVTESGGAWWRSTPGGDIPGEAEPAVTITVHAARGTAPDFDHLAPVIESVMPAHVRPAIVPAPQATADEETPR